jgi:hypothetical protein
MTEMTTLQSTVLTIAQILVVCVAVVVLLELTSYLAGGPAMWGVGIVLLFLAGVALLRLRK